MKIAILSCFYPYRGGIAQFNAALLRELQKSNECRAFNFKRQYPSLLFPGKTQYVIPQDEADAVESEAVLDSILPHTYIHTVREILKWDPDLVIMRYWMSFFAPSLGFVARRLKKKGIKVIAILDNVIPHEKHFFDSALTSYFIGSINGAVTLCDSVAEDLRKIDASVPVKVLPHPLYSHFGEIKPREEALAALGLKPERKTLLFFGLIREYKGLDILIEAFSMLPPEEYQLVICGEPYGSFGRYRALIEDLCKGMTIYTNLNYVRDSQVGQYFSGADLCVLPYRSATQSGVSSISFHFEVPMLVTDTGGLKETIYDTGCGLLSDGTDPESIRRAIVHYFSDSSIRQKCKEAIKRRKTELDWKTFADNLTDYSKTL